MPPSWWLSGSRDAPRRSTSSSSPWKYWKADEGGWVNSCSSATDPPSEDDEVFTPEPKQQRNSGSATAKICSELKPLEVGRSSDHIPVLLTVSLDAKAEPDDDDEVEFSHVRTADERNAEGFANAEFVG